MENPTHERVRNLLTDTVSMLCKNGLQFNTELRLEGVIGITVDRRDVFIVHINESYPGGGVVTAKSKSSQSNVTHKKSSLPSTAIEILPESAHSLNKETLDDDPSSLHEESYDLPSEPGVVSEAPASPTLTGKSRKRRSSKGSSRSGSNTPSIEQSKQHGEDDNQSLNEESSDSFNIKPEPQMDDDDLIVVNTEKPKSRLKSNVSLDRLQGPFRTGNGEPASKRRATHTATSSSQGTPDQGAFVSGVVGQNSSSEDSALDTGASWDSIGGLGGLVAGPPIDINTGGATWGPASDGSSTSGRPRGTTSTDNQSADMVGTSFITKHNDANTSLLG